MTPLHLRSKAVRQLVHVVIDGPSGYRTATELDAFFKSIGHAYKRDRAESRIGYTARVIEQAQRRGQLEAFLAQLVESGDSAVAQEQLRAAISESIAPYGFTVERQPDTGDFRVRPIIFQASPLTAGVLSVPTFQNPPFSQEEIALLQDRWTEAVAMYHAGALRMTMLSLSAVLEHVLLTYAQRMFPEAVRASSKAPQHQGPIRDWQLDLLLDVAAERGWISLKKEDFPYRIRHYRDYLTPARELQQGPFLTEALANDVWHKFKHTLDELSALTSDTTARRPHMTILDLYRKAFPTPPSPE